VSDDWTVSGSAPADWRDYSRPQAAILQAALRCFVESGYQGSTIRQIASAAGLSVAGLYHHYDSKQAILVALMRSATGDLYERSVAALASAGDSVEDRFEVLLDCLVLFHAHRSQLAFIGLSEIRSLEPGAREQHLAARDRQQMLLREIVEEGVASGVFSAERPGEACRAILTMCTGIAQWYAAGGSLTPEMLSREYVKYSSGLLGQDVAGALLPA
jgi:AcrR family transcriptional regulator